MKRLPSFFAPLAAALLMAVPATAQVTFDTFDDGDVSDVGAFSGSGGGIGVGITDGRTGTPNTGLSVGVNPATLGGFGGFVIPGGAGVTNVSSTASLTFYLRPTTVQAANTPFNLEINLHEDTNTNGSYDGGSEDEFQAVVPVTVGSGYTKVTVPLSAFSDDNAVFAGANDGFDYTKLLEIVIAFPTPSGPEFAFSLDDFVFAAAPTITNVAMFDSFDDGDVSDVGAFSGSGGGIGVGPTDGRMGAPNTALSVGVNPATLGGFGGFVIPGGAGVTNVASKTYLQFWFRPTTVQAANLPFNLEINLHEDTNNNGTYEGASEDEFQAVYSVSAGSGWREVQIPLSSFVDDNAVFAGANDGFDYTKLLEIVIAFPTPSGPEFAFALDDIGFGTLSTAAETLPLVFAEAPVLSPNPAQGRVAVRFALAQASEVSVEAFDLLGRRVADVPMGFRAPGRADASVDTEGWPSGTYLVRVTTAQGTSSRLLTVVR